MGCEVCIGFDADCDGQIEMLEIGDVRARREHRCEECRAVIAKGETYERLSGKWEGKFFTQYTCLICAEIAQVFSCGEARPPAGELWETMRDVAFPSLTTATECFRELSAAAKQRVLDRWAAWKGLPHGGESE